MPMYLGMCPLVCEGPADVTRYTTVAHFDTLASPFYQMDQIHTASLSGPPQSPAPRGLLAPYVV